MSYEFDYETSLRIKAMEMAVDFYKNYNSSNSRAISLIIDCDCVIKDAEAIYKFLSKGENN